MTLTAGQTDVKVTIDVDENCLVDPTCGNFCCLLITFESSLDPGHA